MRIEMKNKHRELEPGVLYDAPGEITLDRAKALVKLNLAREVEEPKKSVKPKVETETAEPKAENAIAPNQATKPKPRRRRTRRAASKKN